MSVHVAILQRPYLQAILDGRKTVESRLTKTPRPPHASVKRGERLYFKVSAGPLMASAVAGEVYDLAHQRPEQIDQLAQAWDAAVGGGSAYWLSRRDRPFVTLIHLERVEPCQVGPRFKPIHMRAWYTLDDAVDPLAEVALSAGAIRNRYVAFPGQAQRHRDRPIILDMPDGLVVETALSGRGRMLRWRGWGRYFTAFGMRPGDRVRFVHLGRRRYRVSFKRT